MKKAKKKVRPTHIMGDATTKSAALLSLKWKLRDPAPLGLCARRGCNAKTPGKVIFCGPHKKVLRKRQLELNNIPWKKKVKEQGKKYNPDQLHLAYKAVATPAALRNPDRVKKMLKLERSAYGPAAWERAVEKAKFERIKPVKLKSVTSPSNSSEPVTSSLNSLGTP